MISLRKIASYFEPMLDFLEAARARVGYQLMQVKQHGFSCIFSLFKLLCWKQSLKSLFCQGFGPRPARAMLAMQVPVPLGVLTTTLEGEEGTRHKGGGCLVNPWQWWRRTKRRRWSSHIQHTSWKLRSEDALLWSLQKTLAAHRRSSWRRTCDSRASCDKWLAIEKWWMSGFGTLGVSHDEEWAKS